MLAAHAAATSSAKDTGAINKVMLHTLDASAFCDKLNYALTRVKKKKKQAPFR